MILNQQGLTLVELMVTLAVAIILLAVGVPLFTGVTSSNRAAAQANTFLAAFKLARSEAVGRSTEVSVCAVDDPGADADTLNCGTNADWANGLLVFTDSGTAGTVDGTDDERIRVFTTASGGTTAATPGAFVRFEPQGGVIDITANAVCGASGTCIELGHAENDQTRCLHVMQSGQVRLERGACS
jgi:type IV fimbrial biogenesis protein FimT